MTSTDTFLRTAEAARELGVSRSTLTRWVEAGRIEPALRVPGYRGQFLFDPASLEPFRRGDSA